MGLFGKNYSASSDEQLMALVTEKNARAFDELYTRYGQRMYNYFMKMLWRDKLKAEDFTQDLFAKLIQKPHLYNPERPFKTWLYSVANNMCKNEYKKQDIRKGTNEDLGDRDPQGAHGDEVVAGIDMDSFHGELDKALAELDEKQRETFILRFKQDLSIKEIAEICECSEGTVKSRIFYTIKKLAPKLEMFNPNQLAV